MADLTTLLRIRQAYCAVRNLSAALLSVHEHGQAYLRPTLRAVRRDLSAWVIFTPAL